MMEMLMKYILRTHYFLEKSWVIMMTMIGQM